MKINPSQIAYRETERIINATKADDPRYSREFKELIASDVITEHMINRIAYSIACSIVLMFENGDESHG